MCSNSRGFHTYKVDIGLNISSVFFFLDRETKAGWLCVALGHINEEILEHLYEYILRAEPPVTYYSN